MAEEAKNAVERFKQSSQDQNSSLKSFVNDLQKELKSQSSRYSMRPNITHTSNWDFSIILKIVTWYCCKITANIILRMG